MKKNVGEIPPISRRKILSYTLPLVAGFVASPVLAGQMCGVRSLTLRNVHTGEFASADYWVDGWYDPDVLAEFNFVLRDIRTDDVHPIDKRLLDLLHHVATRLETDSVFELTSGYRSPKTNAALARRRDGVALKSLHMEGKAVDVRVPGKRARDVRRAAMALRAGGIGYYRKSRFLHLDVGAVRYWS